MADSDASGVALDERQLDALRELANIGCGHAASALSKLLGGSAIGIEVPRAELVDIAVLYRHVGGADTPVVGVATDVAGTLSGRLLVLMPDADARALAGLLLGTTPPTGPLSAEAQSAICEAGNIVGSAFVNALADQANLILHPSPPVVIHDMALALVESVYAEILSQGGDVVMIDTVFEDNGGNVAGLLIVAPDSAALDRLLRIAA